MAKDTPARHTDEFPGQGIAEMRERDAIADARRQAKRERAAAKLFAAETREAMANAGYAPVRLTSEKKRRATRARNEKRAFRMKSVQFRRQLRLERLLRLALR